MIFILKKLRERGNKLDYITKNFDEYSAAAEIYETGHFPQGGTYKELLLLAKYLRFDIVDYYGFDLEERDYWDVLADSKDIEKKMIAFCEKAIPYFNYYDYCIEIDYAVKASVKYRMNFADSTPITVNEWKTICSIEDDDARKLLFIKLVDAKYYMVHRKLVKRKKNYSQEYFSREQINKSICCLEMGISRGYGSMRYKRYFAALRKLQDYGFIEFKEIFSQNGSKLIDKVTIVDDDEDSEVLDYITDYHHLELHYERLSGADIGECKECGALFRQQYRNKYKYCEEHRIKTKKQKTPTVRRCYECGTFFDVPVRGNTSKMFFCKSCQEKANKAKKIAWMQNKRKCVETK